jgi:hypothetical protein
MAPAGVATRRELRIILVLTILAAAILWIRPIRSSFWLDETGTAWIVKDGPGLALERSSEFTGGHAAYYVLAAVTAQTLGRSEWALRVPSLVFMALAALTLHALASRLFGSMAAAFAVLLFVTSETVAFEACNARPYALVTFLALLSTLLLVIWCDKPSLFRGAAYAVLAALVLYVHDLFGTVYVVHILYAFRRHRRERRIQLLALLLLMAGVILLLLPRAGHILSLSSRREAVSFAAKPLLPDLVTGVFRPLMLGPVALAVLLFSRGLGWADAEGDSDSSSNREGHALASLLLFVPPGLLFAASRVSGTSVFVERYFLVSVTGLALLLGRLSALLGARGRGRWRLIALMILLVTVPALTSPRHHSNDWRGAARALNEANKDSSMPVLLHPGYVEQKQYDWLDDKKRIPYLSAPLEAYPVRGKTMLLPYDAHAEQSLARLDALAARMGGPARFALVARTVAEKPFRAWLDGRFRPLGYEARDLGPFGNVNVVLYERTAR